MAASIHCTITTRLRRFSSCDGEDTSSTEYDCDDERILTFFKPTFFTNGSCSQNEGHVSIVFNADVGNLNGLVKLLTFSCVASAIDASGSKRFSQSLALDLGHIHKEDRLFFTKGFGFEKFVKRSTLLGDPSELLPDDCLTLCLEIDFEVLPLFVIKSRKYDTDVFGSENGRWYLRMDSAFGRDLCELSSVFRDMMECTIAESGPGRIQIPEEESDSFQLIHDFLSEFTLHGSLSSIRQLYIVADKYDMQPIVRLCHRLLVSVMCAMNTEEKLEFITFSHHL